MAGGDEKNGAGGGGDEEEKVELPSSSVFRFKPKDKEVIEHYLLPRLQGRPAVPNDRIIETNVYEFHPDKLINELYKHRGEDAWYFLSPRARKHQGGGRPSRGTEDDRGRWKPPTGRKEAEETIGDGNVKFCKNSLAYHEGLVKGEEKQTKWLMHEFTIPEYENKVDKSSTGDSSSKTLDKFVMCKIYVTPRDRQQWDEEEASTSNAAFDEELSSSQESGPQASTSNSEELSPSQPGPAAETGEDTAGAKQTGNKRPAEEEDAVAQRPPQRPKLILQEGAPAQVSSYIAGGVQMPLGTPIHENGTGHTMAYAAGHATMSRQHMTFNDPLQMQQRQVAYNNLMIRRQMVAVAAYNRQMLLRRQLAACNGQAPVQQGLVVADNGQASSVQRPPAACNGQAPVVQGPQVASSGQMSSMQLSQPLFNYQYQMLLQRQQQRQRAAMAYNLQLQAQLQWRQMAHNGQTMSVQQPPARYSGQMMPVQGPEVVQNRETSSLQRLAAGCNGLAPVQRPLNVPPVLKLVRPRPTAPTSGYSSGRTMIMQPPPSPVHPPPQQRPPETPAMREGRVVGQLLVEYYHQRDVDEAHAAQKRLMPPQAPQQPCTDAVECNDDGEKRSAEVAPDGSARLRKATVPKVMHQSLHRPSDLGFPPKLKLRWEKSKTSSLH